MIVLYAFVSRRPAKSVLRLPDLEIAKSAVLSSLSWPDARRGYRHTIDEFVDWHCSELRLAFNKTVVDRYRMNLASCNLAPGTVNHAWRGLGSEESTVAQVSPRYTFGTDTAMDPRGSSSGEPSLRAACARYSNHL